MNLIITMFQYPFIQRALIVGVLVSLCAALLGVCLVLKHYSMIGDGLSHVSFGALSVAVALGVSPLWISIPIVIIASFCLLRISENAHMKNDAAIAVVSSSALAIGITVTALTTGINTDVSSYMFGSILVMNEQDVMISIVLCVIVLALFILFYSRIFSITFDENFSKASGIPVGRFNALLSVLTAVTITLGMRMMGAMLISSLIIFPALIAMRLQRSFSGVIIAAAITAVIDFLLGLVISFLLSTPTGASIVLVNLCVLLIVTAIQKIRGK
ncbi:MAG: metal ABC transporter permease [Firmicutes bacterium]|nr:metal ABC transporter permease [Bacillota bacterium]MDY4817273.1 metal ABC transporter permease [Lachnospiraceae bacterium]